MVTTVRLTTGAIMPTIGLGTWQSKEGEVGEAVRAAIDCGYRHIDCAHAYLNQAEIGKALNSIIGQTVKRENLFVTSKVWNTFHSHDAAIQLVDTMLHDLQLDYLDLCLIHWPMGYEEGAEVFPKTPDGQYMRWSDVNYMDTWKALEECVQAGKVRAIGVSNFNSKQIQRIIDNGTIKPAVVQVEMHPYLQQHKLLQYCRERDIVVTAYSPLASQGSPFRKGGDLSVFEDATFVELGKKYNKTPAQVALRWGVQRGTVIIPKSVSAHRIKENFDVYDFALTPEEMEQINAQDKAWRICSLKARDGKHPHYPFHEEF